LKRSCAVRFLAVLGILILLFTNAYSSIPALAESGKPSDLSLTGSKVSGLLSLHVQIKKNQMTKSSDDELKSLVLDQQSIDEIILTDIDKERVFLHFTEQPTESQIQELNSLGVTVYSDSWIPPVNNFKTGFVLAEIPVDKLDSLINKSYIVFIDTAEQMLSPLNDIARTAMNVDPVWSGGYTGAGVTVAIIDSGIDTSNPDFPPLDSSNSKDYSNYPTLDNTITNQITGHGTHVAGSLLGRGTSSSSFKGVAPDANLVFIKVGNDTTGIASSDAVTYAIRDAVDIYHAQIINLSMGSWSQYHDGTDQTCQAVDYATSKGTVVFAAAGNEAQLRWHYIGQVNGNSTTSDFSMIVTSGGSYLPMNLVWYDGLGVHNNLSLEIYNSNHDLLSSISSGQSESPRGTEENLYQIRTAVNTGTYFLRVKNNSPDLQVFHIYYMGGSNSVTFQHADSRYTICSPAEADSAIAVGAYISRDRWTNYKGLGYILPSSEVVGNMATYSAIGPRVDDGAPDKPNIAAPGSAIISVRDPLYTPGNSKYDPLIIDNDGLNLNGSGPAKYYVMQGTSCASPLAAGVAALLLQKTPGLTPAQVRHHLEATANFANQGRNPVWGWGLINADAVVNHSTTLDSYSDASGINSCNDFNSGTDLSNAKVYFYSPDLLYNHTYRLSYYDGIGSLLSTNKVTTSVHILSASINLLPGNGNAGTWHVIVSEPEFTPPEQYNTSWSYLIMSDSFNVQHSPPGSPTVFTVPVSNLNDIYATLNGNLADLGIASSVQVYFEYGLNPNYTDVTVPQMKLSSETGTFSIKITGLTPGQTYHFRAVADGGNGKVSTGVDMVFITPINHLSGKIVFSSRHNNLYTITTMNWDGSHQTPLISGFSYTKPAQSPDGSKIAFLNGNSQIYIIDADGSNLTLLRSCSLGDGRPSWSPDGSKIAFSEKIQTNQGIFRAICIINIDGSGWQRLTSDNPGSYCDDPSWSPDGSKIAYVTEVSNLCVMDADGTDPVRITNYDRNFGPPDWASDGSKLVYAAMDGDGTFQIYTIKVDGSEKKNLTKNIAPVQNSYPAWSPDGSKIVFGSERSGGQSQIYIMNGDGRFPINLSNSTFTDTCPTWTSRYTPEPLVRTIDATNVSSSTVLFNGQLLDTGEANSVTLSFEWGTISGDYSCETIAQHMNNPGSFNQKIFGLNEGSTYYYRTKAIGNGTKYGIEKSFTTLNNTGLIGKIAYTSGDGVNREIYIMNADGSGQARVTNNNFCDSLPALSQDGNKIAFLSWREGSESRIYVIDSDGNNEVKLTNTDAMNYQPAWSPDGTKIAYLAKVNGHNQIFTMNSNGTDQHQITYSGDNGNPTWSPDGTKIAYESGDICIIDQDGNNLRCITNIGFCLNPAWSPDGSKIAYQTVWGTAVGWVWYQIQTVNIDGTQTSTVYNRVSPGPISWSPDSKRIAFTSNLISNYSINVINIDGTNLTRLTTGDSVDLSPSWSSSDGVAPVIASSLPANTHTGAVIKGKLLDPGTASQISVHFDWYSDNHCEGGTLHGIPVPPETSSDFEARLNKLTDGETYHYRAKAVGDGTAYGDDVAFTFSIPKIVFISPIQSLIAGSVSDTMTLQIQSTSENSVIADGNIDINLSSTSEYGKFDTSTTGLFDGSITRVTIPDGSNLVSFYYKDIQAGHPTLTASSLEQTTESQQVTVNPAEAYQIKVEMAADGSGTVAPVQNLAAGNSIAVYAVVRDQFGNFIANAGGVWSLVGKTGSVDNTDLVPAGDGKRAMFTAHRLGSAVIRVESTGLSSVDSGIITVVPKLNIAGFPSPATAGTAHSFTVTVQDGLGATVNGYIGTIHFSSSDTQAALPDNYTFGIDDQGIHEFTGILKRAGSQSITATDALTPLINGRLTNITVVPAAKNQLVWGTQPPVTVTAGIAWTSFTVKITDEYGNQTADSDSIAITPSSGILSGTLNQAAVAGLATFGDIRRQQAGTITLTAILQDITSPVSNNVSIAPDIASQIRVETDPSGRGTVVPVQNVTAGQSLMVYAVIRDQFGNFIANAGGTWSIVNPQGGVVNEDLASSEDNKSAVFSGHLTGTADIRVVSEDLNSVDSNSLTVVPGAKSKLIWGIQPPAATIAGETWSEFTIKITDPYGNQTSDKGTVTIIPDSGILRGTLNRNAIAGLVSFDDISRTQASTLTLTATSGTLTATPGSSKITVNPAAASQIRVETKADGTGSLVPITSLITGQALTVFGVTRDQYDNYVGNPINTTWSLTSKTGGIAESDLSAASGASVTLTAHLAGSTMIKAVNGTLDSVDSGIIYTTLNPPSQISLTVAPVLGDSVNDQFTIQPVIRVTDQGGTPAGGVNVVASRGIGTGTLRGNLTATTDAAGLATFSDLGYNKSGEPFTLSFTAGILVTNSSSLGPLNPGTATRIKIETAVNGSGTVVGTRNLVAGDSLTVFGITRDQYNSYIANPADTTWSLTSTTGEVVESDLSAASGASVTLEANSAGSAIIHAVNGSLTPVDSGTIFITLLPPSQISLSIPPIAGASVDYNFTTQPVVLVTDSGGHPVGGVTVTASGGTGTGILRGTLTATTDAAGLAVFTNLGYNKSGEAFSIHFTTDSLMVNSGSLGPLAVGAATQVRVETTANGSGTLVGARSLTIGISLTVYAITRDQFDNSVGNPSNATWSLTSKTIGVAESDLSPATGASTVMTGHQVGTGIIHVVIPGLSSVDSGKITVVAPSGAEGGNGGGGGTGGGGSGGGSSFRPVTISGLAPNTNFKINSSGLIQNAVQLKTEDGKVTFGISSGTKLMANKFDPIYSFTAILFTSPPAPPSNNALIQAYKFGPDGATFDPPLALTMSYDPADLPKDVAENDLYIAYWDGTKWLSIQGTVATVAKTVSVKISHFSNFALLGQIVVPTPTPTPTTAPTATPTPTPSFTQIPTQTEVLSPTPTPTLIQIVTPTPTQTIESTAAPIVIQEVTPSPTPNPEPGKLPTKTSNWPVIIGIIVAASVILAVSALIKKRRK
jgi:Tol biopolymer transport system component